MQEKYDVVVIGAGAAGLAAAKSAAKEGAKTLVLEMRAKVGGLTNFESLLPVGLAGRFKKAVVTNVEEVEIQSVHERLPVRGKIGKLVDREKLSEILAQEAVSSGAEIWISAPVRELLVKNGVVKGIKAESGGWSETVKAEVVIDASGAGGPWSSIFLRKVLGKDWRPEEMAFSSEYLMANAEGGTVQVYFTSYLAPRGRAWVYPFGNGFASVGIYGVGIHPDMALDEFLGKVSPRPLANAAPIAMSRGQIPLQGPLEQACGHGIIAVGGAAGHLCPLSGRGLSYALKGGEIAGRAAVDAITEGDVSVAGLSEHNLVWKSNFGWELEACGILHSSLAVAQDRRMDEILRVLKGNPLLGRAFLNLLIGAQLKKSLRNLMSSEVAEILGHDAGEKILRLV